MRLIFLFVFTVLIFYQNCSDEFNLLNKEIDLLSEYKEVAVVNANISLADTIHFIRVQRGFHAEDFTAYSHDVDSLYYDPNEIEVNAYILRINQMIGNEVVDADTLFKYNCEDTTVLINTVGDVGVINPTLYYFREPTLRKYGFKDTYIGVEVINGNKKYYAHTKIVDAVGFALSPYARTFPIEDNTFDVSMLIPKYTSRYIVTMKCSYTELKIVDNKLVTTVFTYNFPVADVIYKNPSAHSDSVKYTFSVSNFHSRLEKHILDFGDHEKAFLRRLKDVYFTSVVFNNDLLIANNGLLINGSGYNDVPGYFTNIKNGQGYLSAYGENATKKYALTSLSIRQFIDSVGYKYVFQ